MVLTAHVEHAVDKLCALCPVAEDTADSLRIEVATVVVGKHRQHRHTGLTHLTERLVVDTGLKAVCGRIDEEPLRDNHVKLAYTCLKGRQRTGVPVDIPCRTDTDTRVVPFVDKFLGNLVAMADKAMGAAVVLHIVVVHAGLQKLVTHGFIGTRRLVILHERLGSGHRTAVVMTERKVRTTFHGKHSDKNNEQ